MLPRFGHIGTSALQWLARTHEEPLLLPMLHTGAIRSCTQQGIWPHTAATLPHTAATIVDGTKCPINGNLRPHTVAPSLHTAAQVPHTVGPSYLPHTAGRPRTKQVYPHTVGILRAHGATLTLHKAAHRT